MADFLSKLNIDSIEHMIRGCGIPYGVVDSTSTSTAFTATVPGINELKNGVIMLLKNGKVTSASGFTINVNGLGAKPSYTNLAASTADTTIFNVNYTMLFIYDETRVSGGCWICYRGYDADTTTARGYQDYYFRSYAGSAIYRYKFLMEGANHRLYPIVTTNQTSATQVTKSPQTVGLRPWKIWYYDSTTTINAGGAIGAQTILPATTANAVYNFNASTGTYAWIYLVGNYNADTDLFTLDSSTTGYYKFIAQNTTPSSTTFTTGKYYLLLGASYSITNYVSLFNVNPFYYFDGTHLIPVTSKIAADKAESAAEAAIQTLDSSISATTGQAISAITITDGKITDSSKISIPTVTDTYSSTSTDAMSGKAVNAALQTLDSSISATTGQAISAITITDGKIASSSKVAVGETNQNAFSNFKVDATTISASSKTDTFEFYAGQNITITADATNKKITIDADADSSVYIVHASLTINGGTITYTTNADWDDAYNALLNGSNVIMQIDTLDMQQTSVTGGHDYYVKEYSSTSIIFQNHNENLALIGWADEKEKFTWSKTSPTVMTRSRLLNVPVDAVEATLSGNSGRIPTSAAIKTYVDSRGGDIFWCTHGSTTDTEIQDALDTNKLPVVVYNGNLYVYYWTTSGYRYFMSFVNNTHSRIMMSQSSSYWGTPTNLLMEQTSNRVSAIDSTAADNKYPSALAVKTYVDNTLATSGNVFWCTYGTTTASEVQAAIDSGKYPVVKGNNYTLPFITDDGTYYRFCGVNKNTMCAFYLKKDNSVWSDGFWQNAVISTQIKTSISSSSTDTDIPSAKCVYDALSVVPPSYIFEATLSSTTVTLSNSKTIGDLVTAWNNGANEVYIKVNSSKYRISHISLITTGYYYLYTDGIINAISSAYRSVSYLYVNMSAAEDSNTLLYSSLALDVPAVVFSATLSGTTVTLSNSKTLNDIYSVYSLSGTKQVYIAVDSNRFAVTRCTKSGSNITLDTAPVHVYTGSHTIRAVYARALAQTSTTLTHYSKTL